MTAYGDIQTAFLCELRHLFEEGDDIEVRGYLTRELRARLVQIENVRDRYLIVPSRNNNVFASIAESMWVIAGRNDLEYLSAYLPRANAFSDDGKTWRAGYGPRLRNWNGVDQLAEVAAILRTDPSSRRAVAAIYDPDRDFVQSNDIPCNNWLHFMIREGHVDLHVAARSTDIWWGFSGINAFEWSLLLEMMSFWLGREPGQLVLFTSSMHLYKRHFEKAERILAMQLGAQPKARSYSEHPAFETPWGHFAAEMTEWMRLEHKLRSGFELSQLDTTLSDPLMNCYIQMIDLFWTFKRRDGGDVLEQKLAGIPDESLREAADEFVHRTHSQHH